MNKGSLTFKDTVFYGLPGMPLAMLGLPLFIYLPSFYSQELGLSLTAVGLALLLARSFDVVTDPIIGVLNDHYPKLKLAAWRRKSFILLGLPLLLVGLIFLLKPSKDINAFYLFAWSFITYLGWTLINIPWLAMGAEISKNYHEKSELASSREIFAAIGTIGVLSIPVVFASESNNGASSTKESLDILATVLIVLIPVSLIPLLWKVTPVFEKADTKTAFESKSKPKPETSLKTISEEIPKASFYSICISRIKQLIAQTSILLKQPDIKRLLPAYFVNSVANALPATLFILYVNYVLQTPNFVGILLLSYFIAAIIGIPFWLYIARRSNKQNSWRYALYGSIASFIWVPFLGQGDFMPFLIICLSSGFCLGADAVMPSSIQADIAQRISDQSQTDDINNNANTTNNTDPTGLLFGLWGMITKLSLAIAIGISFPILDLVGLNVNSGVISETSKAGTITLITLYALSPVILKIWLVLRLKRFSFDQEDEDSISTSSDYKRGFKNDKNNVEDPDFIDTSPANHKRL